MFQVLNGVNQWAAFLMLLLYSCINYCNFIWDFRQYFVFFLLLFSFLVFQALFILHASLTILPAFPSLHIWSSCHWVGSPKCDISFAVSLLQFIMAYKILFASLAPHVVQVSAVLSYFSSVIWYLFIPLLMVCFGAT